MELMYGHLAAGELLLHDIGGASIATDPSNSAFVGVGSSLWIAAPVLAAYCRYCAALQPGSTILELGAGCGAVGLSLAVAGHHLTLTDEPQLLPLLRFNAARNAGSGVLASVAPLRWGDAAHLAALGCVVVPPAEYEHGGPRAWDVLLASDVAYDPEQHGPLLDTLAALAWQRRPTPRRVAAALQCGFGGGGVRLQLGVLRGADDPRGAVGGGATAFGDASAPARVLLALPDRGDEMVRFASAAAARGWLLSPQELPPTLSQQDAMSHRVVIVECTPPSRAAMSIS